MFKTSGHQKQILYPFAGENQVLLRLFARQHLVLEDTGITAANVTQEFHIKVYFNIKE